jgi:oligopeptidase B
VENSLLKIIFLKEYGQSQEMEKQVPISLVYHKDTKKSADTPLLLYGYGSYGHTVDASFSNVRLSILDRGFIYALLTSEVENI